MRPQCRRGTLLNRSMSLSARFALAFALALALSLALSLAARRARVLSVTGAWSAVAVGTIAVVAGWPWTAVLLAFFASSSALSRWRRATKERATSSVVEKGGERDAWQVLANGGVFTLCALGAILWPAPAWTLAGLGALASATADTWATEVGTAIGGIPRAIATFRPVPAGTSGAVTLAGSLAMVAGALFLGTTALLAGFAKETLRSGGGGRGSRRGGRHHPRRDRAGAALVRAMRDGDGAPGARLRHRDGSRGADGRGSTTTWST